jgi:hypothetical protein
MNQIYIKITDKLKSSTPIVKINNNVYKVTK